MPSAAARCPRCDHDGALYFSPCAPKYTATWLARYTVAQIEGLGDFSVQGSGYYQSRSIAQDVTPYDPITHTVMPQTILQSRHVIDARLEWAKMFGHAIDLQLYVRNLTKQKYYTQINDSYASPTFGNTAAILGDPRTYGMTVKYVF